MNGLSQQYVLIAANPNSGAKSSRSRVAELQQAIVSAGFLCQVEYSLEKLRSDCLHLDSMGKLCAVVSAGGDGTVSALANLLPCHIPFLLFPLGTENLLAKHLGITGDIGQACDILARQQRHLLDLGSANGKLFLVMLSCGFDAEVVQQMHAIRTGHINRWSYTRPILRSLGNYSFPQLSYSSSNFSSDLEETRDPQSGSAAWLFVFNVPRYAAGLNFCPQADPVDGQLDLCTFRKSGIAFGLGYLLRLWLGSHQRMRGFQHKLSTHLQIPAPRGVNGSELRVPFQIDGDPGGVLPLDIQVLPRRLTLLVP